ncbi:DUF2958 domain-containing protein [Allosphingosinicella humi]
MILLTPDLRALLRANDIARHTVDGDGAPSPDPAPIVKFFNPVGAEAWLATELYDDGDTLFGLADLGFCCPELGLFSLSEIASVRLPFGLGIERDINFASDRPLSVWADTARRTGSIIAAETLLRRQAANPLPNPGNDRDG